MWVFATLGFICTALIVLLIVSTFISIKRTPLYLLIPIFLAVYIPSSIVVLLPVDISCSDSPSDTIFCISLSSRYRIWRVLYWLQFVITWAVLPMLQGYIESGNIDTMKKIKDSLKRNAKFQLIMLSIGIIAFIYFIVSLGLSITSIKGLLIALSHCYALVLAIWLMGHGLVNIPRKLFYSAFLTKKLKQLQISAPSVHDNFIDSEQELSDIVAEISSLSGVKDGPYLEWIDHLCDSIGSYPTPRNNPPPPNRNNITEQYLAALTKKFYKAEQRRTRYNAEWIRLVQNASNIEDIIKAKSSKRLTFSHNPSRLSPRLCYIVYAFVAPFIKITIALILSAFSFIITWSEVTHNTRLTIIGIVISNASNSGQQVFSSIILSYMILAAFHSLSKVRIFSFYALVVRHTDLSSAIFYSMYASRLAVPLSYNYLNLLLRRDSAFEEFLGKSINLTILGKYFNDWLPRFILIPVILTLFDVYSKLSKAISYDLNFDQEGDSGNYLEGRELIARELHYNRSGLLGETGVLSDNRPHYINPESIYNNGYNGYRDETSSSLARLLPLTNNLNTNSRNSSIQAINNDNTNTNNTKNFNSNNNNINRNDNDNINISSVVENGVSSLSNGLKLGIGEAKSTFSKFGSFISNKINNNNFGDANDDRLNQIYGNGST